ncbi:MAG: undecaprenyl-diphosphate phosphatase, partial [candidate division WOR-3 bacterium]
MTEFLPVSSSGHLVFFENILKYNPKGIGLEVLLHVSTSLAIVFYFSKRILNFYKNYYKEVIIG